MIYPWCQAGCRRYVHIRVAQAMLDKLKRLYENSPAFIKRLYARVPYRLRLGKAYRKTRRLLGESDGWSRAELEAYQDEKVGRLVEHAYKTVPFYRSRMEKCSLRPGDIRDRESLRNLPLLTKEEIKQHSEELLSENASGMDTHFATTGGTTGEPLGLYFSNNCYGTEWAFMHDQWSRVGFTPGDRNATLRGRHFEVEEGKVYVDNPIYHERCLSIYHLKQSYVSDYVRALQTFHPQFIHGYPSAIHRFALLLQRSEETAPSLKAALCGSEQIYPHQREVIEDVFGCRVFSWYGQTEKVILAGECECSTNYHAYPQYGVTEIVREDGSPCEPGEVGELVGTGFMNTAMPLIRYKTGDPAAGANRKCSCGRAYPVIKKVVGREQDHVVTSSGRLIPLTGMLFGAHLSEYQKLQKIQIEQWEPGEAMVRVVPAKGVQLSELQGIVEAYEDICDGDCKFTLEEVSDIPTTEEGKHQYLIQHVNLGAIKESHE